MPSRRLHAGLPAIDRSNAEPKVLDGCRHVLNGFGAAGGVGSFWQSGSSKANLPLTSMHFAPLVLVIIFPANYAAERTRESVKYYYRLRFPNDENEWRGHIASASAFSTARSWAAFGENRLGASQLLPAGNPGANLGVDQRSGDGLGLPISSA